LPRGLAPTRSREQFPSPEGGGSRRGTASHLERLRRYLELSDEELHQMLGLADRVCAMLTGLIHRHS
jgi:hypothetical protein